MTWMLQSGLPLVYCWDTEELQNQGHFCFHRIYLRAFSLATEIEKSRRDLGQENKEDAQAE